MRRNWWFLGSLLVVGFGAGCTSLLGDFPVEETLYDAGPDVGAKDGTTPDANVDASHESDAGIDAYDASHDAVVDAPQRGCKNVDASQSFPGSMYGCPGHVIWDHRNELCANGCTACASARWASTNGVVIPKHHYWTDDDLFYTGGSSFTCGVRALTKGESPCSSYIPDAAADAAYVTSPMRVCMGNTQPDASYGVYDPEGNLCNVTHCGYNGDTPDAQDLYFGGCGGNPTAGTLCCCP